MVIIDSVYEIHGYEEMHSVPKINLVIEIVGCTQDLSSKGLLAIKISTLISRVNKPRVSTS